LEVRKSIWGYAPEESLCLNDMINVEYRGIRPACGYPT
jgi:5-methyltetrahydrofolate--homocysteine methyltransferase